MPDDAGARVSAIIREIGRGTTAVLRRAAAETLLYCESHSSGITILTEPITDTLTHTAGVGAWARSLPHVDSASLSPQGYVIRRRAAHLFRRPDTYFSSLRSIRPLAVELLATPFLLQGNARAVLWIALHEASRQFDQEDARRLRLLAQCASASCLVASSTSLDMTRTPRLAIEQVDDEHDVADGARPLSDRERQVCMLVARGFTGKIIGEMLGIGSKSVDTYRRRIADKLGLRRRADYVAYVQSRKVL